MLTIEKTLLVVVDIQGNLYRAMNDREDLLNSSRRLIKGAVTLGLPVLVTEQNNIGATVLEISELLPGVAPIKKDSFSCCGEALFMAAVEAMEPQRVLLCGIEAHVCVYQTALDLVTKGYQTYVAADAVSSRTAANKAIALQRLGASGVVVTSTEMALFELLKTAADPRAREIFKIVK